MKIMDKLKNALFEEEYVEIEEKPKARKDSRKEKGKQKPEKPIAKKIVSTPPQPERKVIEDPIVHEEKKEEALQDRELLKSQNEFRFPVMAEEDFSVTQPIDLYSELEVTKEKKPLYHEPVKEKPKEEKPLYSSPKPEPSYDYGTSHQTHVAYEKKAEPVGFKPSPIISPIYGVLDKNYRKEEVRDKKEIRISSFSRENLDLDAVRRKAYGDLADELEDLTNHVKNEISDDSVSIEDQLLVDLSQEDKPTVKKVTVGDAEEYFKDLGLEYNSDYIDASKTQATGRRTKKEVVDTDQKVEKEKKVDEDDDNLFDLIDSMYNEE